MTTDRADRLENEQLEGLEEERPLPRHVLASPEMQAKIAEARRNIEEGNTIPGKTAEELLNLAREQRVDTRSKV